MTPHMTEPRKFQWCRNAEILLKERVQPYKCVWDCRVGHFLKKINMMKLFEQITIQLWEDFPALQNATTGIFMRQYISNEIIQVLFVHLLVCFD